MYQEKKLTPEPTSHLSPAQLLIGSDEATNDAAIRLMQSILCTQGGCQACSTCIGIGQQKHYALQWVTPQERYTLDDVQPIHDTIALALDDDSHYFFVLTHADRLSTSCANTLLKIVEEPPQGYHFIFLSENREAILPTIRSRCVIKGVSAASEKTSTSPLLPFFKTIAIDNPSLFLQTLESSKIGEREAINLINAALDHWVQSFKNAPSEIHMHDAQHALKAMQGALENPPTPGSSKLFLKNLYLQLKQIP